MTIRNNPAATGYTGPLEQSRLAFQPCAHTGPADIYMYVYTKKLLGPLGFQRLLGLGKAHDRPHNALKSMQLSTKSAG